MLLIITPASVASERCGWEFKCAEALSKRTVPIVFIDVPEDQVPEGLRRKNFIFFTPGNRFAQKLVELAVALRVHVDWLREHTRLAEVAARWRSRGEPPFLLLSGPDLEAAKAWLAASTPGAPQPTDLHNQFIAASAEAQNALVRRERAKRHRMVIVLSAATIVFAVLAVGAVGMWFVARDQAEALRASQSALVSAVDAAEEQTRIAETNLALAKAEELKRQRLDFLRLDVMESIRKFIARPEIDPTELGIILSAVDSGLSWSAMNMLTLAEVGSRSNYVRRFKKPTLLGGRLSGVTIGVGYDLRYASEQEFVSVWKGLLPDAAIDQLKPAVHLAHDEAIKLLPSLQNIEISFAVATAAYGRQVKTTYERTAEVFEHIDELHPDSYSALVSLVYNRGTSMKDVDSRTEMRKIRDHMAARRFDLIPDEIRAMSRLWKADPGAGGLVRRRELEAELFETGLAKMKALEAATSNP